MPSPLLTSVPLLGPATIAAVVGSRLPSGSSSLETTLIRAGPLSSRIATTSSLATGGLLAVTAVVSVSVLLAVSGSSVIEDTEAVFESPTAGSAVSRTSTVRVMVTVSSGFRKPRSAVTSPPLVLPSWLTIVGEPSASLTLAETNLVLGSRVSVTIT